MPGSGEMTETASGSGKWRLRVFAGRDAHGRVRHVKRSMTGTKREAKAELAKMIADIERGTLTAGHPTTVSELLERWLADVEHQRSLHTLRGYRRMAEVNIGPAIGSIKIDKLTGRQLDDFYRSLRERGLAPASVRRHHALLHVALGRAVKWGLIAVNPADKATQPRAIKPVVEAPSVEQVQRLIETAERDDPVLATAIALAAVTGARRGELCALRWSDVDWDRRVLRVARSLTVIKELVSEGPTKIHQGRFLAMDDAMVAMLKQRRASQDRYASQTRTILVDDAFILSRSADGSLPCLPDGLSHAYQRLAGKLGHRGHLHELRHFAATVAISSGTDVRSVAGRLGHADASVTLRLYAHALEARDRDLAALLGQAVLGTKRRQEAQPGDHPLRAD